MSFLVLQSGLLYFYCHVTVCMLCLFLTVPWAGMQYVIVPFSDHTNLYNEHISDFVLL